MKGEQPHIFIINLEQEDEKRRHMQSICEKFALDYTIIKAVDGNRLEKSELDKAYSQQEAIAQFGKPLTMGEIGCFLSHKIIYKKMIDEKIEKAIILEDDISIVSDFKKVIDSIDNLPKDWELVLLGYHCHLKTEKESLFSYWYRKNLFNQYESVRLLGKIFGTYGYLINLNGAIKLFAQKITRPIDHYVANDKCVNLYAIRPRVVRINYELHAQSSIEKDRKLRNSIAKKLLKSGKKPIKQPQSKLSILYSRMKRPRRYV